MEQCSTFQRMFFNLLFNVFAIFCAKHYYFVDTELVLKSLFPIVCICNVINCTFYSVF